nr:PREDICTED: zinc finger matrin-type protein 4-like isoform X2 [Lepisosteus oculatus]
MPPVPGRRVSCSYPSQVLLQDKEKQIHLAVSVNSGTALERRSAHQGEGPNQNSDKINRSVLTTLLFDSRVCILNSTRKTGDWDLESGIRFLKRLLKPSAESKKHANKVRLFYMLHPEDGGPPSKRLRPDNPDSDECEVDRNKCCTLCNMFFTSAIVAQSHYQGKTHAKRVRLVLGEPPNMPSTTDSIPSTPQPTDPTPPPTWPLATDSKAGKTCCLCGAWFNNPLMAQQHYEGKKHKRNAARARLLEQLAGSLDATETTALRSSYSCSVCNVILNSIEQYHAHLQGSKHQNNSKNPSGNNNCNLELGSPIHGSVFPEWINDSPSCLCKIRSEFSPV